MRHLTSCVLLLPSEVIPFLVLAIGIDNVFIILNTYGVQPAHLSPEQKLSNTLAEVRCACHVALVGRAWRFSASS